MVPGLGRSATEEDAAVPGTPRGAAENAVIAPAAKGVRSAVVRLAPCVHTAQKQGMAGVLTGIAREHFGMFYDAFLVDNPCSNALTKQRMSWQPSKRTLLEDLKESLGYGMISTNCIGTE